MTDTKATNFYAVEHNQTGPKVTVYVEATSMAKAKGHIDKDLITVRRATTHELLANKDKIVKAAE